MSDLGSDRSHLCGKPVFLGVSIFVLFYSYLPLSPVKSSWCFAMKKKIVIANFIFDIRFNSLTRNSLFPNGKSRLLRFHSFLLYLVLRTEIYLFGINDRRLNDAEGGRDSAPRRKRGGNLPIWLSARITPELLGRFRTSAFKPFRAR